mmetsp:Transcript_31557/g.69072  ORF Transcript_31557/g.69072 Transcript_31557/m.69072 type:complete len:99 (+) Transcript_31557:588-884(+)
MRKSRRSECMSAIASHSANALAVVGLEVAFPPPRTRMMPLDIPQTLVPWSLSPILDPLGTSAELLGSSDDTLDAATVLAELDRGRCPCAAVVAELGRC